MSSAFSWGHVIVLVLLVPSAFPQEVPKSQPPVWSTKPDTAAFEKIENDHLAAAQRDVDRIVTERELTRSRTRWLHSTMRPGN